MCDCVFHNMGIDIYIQRNVFSCTVFLWGALVEIRGKLVMYWFASIIFHRRLKTNIFVSTESITNEFKESVIVI